MIALLSAQAWRGNVRELRQAVETAVALAEGGTVAPHHFELDGAEAGEGERERLVAALGRCGWNQARAAAVLGIGRRTLCRQLDRHGIARPRKRA